MDDLTETPRNPDDLTEIRRLTSLVGEVFSWSIKDILNKDLNRHQIKTIPDRFGSIDAYHQCFVPHLLEETRTELLTSFKSLSKAPFFEIRDLKKKSSSENLSDKLLYDVKLMEGMNKYKPKCGDLIVFTKKRPRGIDDLNPLLLGYVCYSKDNLMISVNTSTSIPYLEDGTGSFGVYLMNLITNTRIWNALHYTPEDSSLVKTVLQENTLATENCALCSNDFVSSDQVLDLKLNASQEAAIFSCLKTRNCLHRHSVKLIWGPPGTGKTKTVASLLFALLNLNCKTVVCAPTNTAIVQVASRLLSLLKEASASDHATTYGLGNMVLSGNRERMGIKENDVLLDVFLDERICKIRNLFSSYCGWRDRLVSLIDFLKNTEAYYAQHVKNIEEAEKRFQKETERNNKREVKIPTFGEFVESKFNYSSEVSEIDMVDLYTHLPKSLISSEQVKNM